MWIAVFFEEIDVPFAGNVGMLQKHGPQFLVIFGPRLNRAPETALAPVADRARLAHDVDMFQNKRRQGSLGHR